MLSCYLSFAASLEDSREGNISKLAEVVGSNHPTQSTFINLVEHGIILASFSIIVGQT
jgi:hypothetical protein